MSTADLSPNVVMKLEILQRKLKVETLESALDKSLNIANYIADMLDDPSSKLLVEQNGRFTELQSIT